MTADILKRVVEDEVRFVCLQFTDVTGAVKSVDIPVRQLAGAIEDGVWFDGSSVEGFARIQESDMRLILDTSTYAVLPWSPPERRRARVFCDIFRPNGTPFAGDPRGVLKRILAELDKRGWQYNVGPGARILPASEEWPGRRSTQSPTTSAATSISPPATRLSASGRS